MAFTPGSNQAQVCFDFTFSGIGCSICLWFLDNDGLDTQRLNTLAGILDGWMANDVMPLLVAQLAYNGLTAYDMSASDAAKVVVSQVPPVNGGISGQGEGNQVAALVSFETGGRGRTTRGRAYVPGVPQNSLELNNLTGAFRNGLDAAWLTMFGLTSAQNFFQIVSSSQIDGQPRTARTARVLNSASTKAKPGTQRRRVDYGDGL